MACHNSLEGVQLGDTCSTVSPLGWLSSRISFSDGFTFTQTEGTTLDCYERKEMFERKDAPSEFEFSMPSQADDRVTRARMLPADELFFQGELLPLHITAHSQAVDQCSMREDKSNKFSAADRVDNMPSVLAHAMPSATSAVTVDPCPLSPKAPKCSSSWRELLGLRKMPVQGAKDSYLCEAERKEKTACCNKAPFPAKSRLSFFKSPDAKVTTSSPVATESPLTSSSTSGSSLFQPSNFYPVVAICCQDVSSPVVSASLSSEPSPSFPPRNCINPSPPKSFSANAYLANQALPLSAFLANDDEDTIYASAKMKEDNDGTSDLQNRTFHSRRVTNGSIQSGRKYRASSPGRNLKNSSPGRHYRGSPERPCIGDGPQNSHSRRIELRSLQRSSSCPKSVRNKHDQIRHVRQRDGWRGLERSSSYSSSVRVTPVLYVPIYIGLGLRGRKGAKNGAFGFGHLFTSKKEKLVKT